MRIRHFDKLIIVLAEGAVAEGDLVRVATLVNAASPPPTHVLLDIHRAELPPPVLATLLKVKQQYERAKISFVVISPSVAGADARTLASALESTRTAEGERITELLAQEQELRAVQLECAKLNAELAARLGADPVAPGSVARAISALDVRHQRLLRQFRTLMGGIQSGGEAAFPDPKDPATLRVVEAKRRVLDAARAAGALD